MRPRTLIWLALPLVMWWLLRAIPLQDVRDSLGGLSVAKLVWLAALNILILLSFNSRWWLILRAQGYKLRFIPLLGYRTASFAISYFTPGTQFGGEPLQVLLLSKRHPIPQQSALTAVALDKIFELLANFTFLITGVALILGRGLITGLSPVLALGSSAGLLLLPLIYLFALWHGRAPLSWIVSRLPSQLLKIGAFHQTNSLVESMEKQIYSLFRGKPATILWASFVSGSIWALLLLEYWLVVYFLGAELNLVQTIAALTAARIAFLMPLPGGLGALEASQVLAMAALGFNPALGIAVALWIRVRDIVIGVVGLWWGGALLQGVPDLSLQTQAGD